MGSLQQDPFLILNVLSSLLLEKLDSKYAFIAIHFLTYKFHCLFMASILVTTDGNSESLEDVAEAFLMLDFW